MWWLPIAAVAAGVLVFVIARHLRADAKRSAEWGNLRERGKLFTSQLAHLRDVQEQKESGKP